jgi:hypothetical protein
MLRMLSESGGNFDRLHVTGVPAFPDFATIVHALQLAAKSSFIPCLPGMRLIGGREAFKRPDQYIRPRGGAAQAPPRIARNEALA